ncbi:MAG: PqqD family protein [Acidobacteria bacterium]|nr:PqqD family protein [Acidobacteriota bacterium]
MTTEPHVGARVTVPAHVVVRIMRDTTVLLNSRTGRYFTLDDVGTSAWNLLVVSPSLGEAYDALLREYDVAPDDLRRDLDALVDRLVVEGLLERVGA